MSPSRSAPVPAAVEATRWVAVASVVALAVLFVVRALWVAPGPWTPPRAGLLLVTVAPLAFAVPGLLRRRMYTYRWVSLLVWLYALFALVRASSDRGASVPLALLETALCLVLFAACAMHVRLRLRASPTAKP